MQAHLADRTEVRVWVPRCGVGAEAFSWAALLRPSRPAKLWIFATDKGARASIDGIFSDAEVEPLDDAERSALVVRGVEGWEGAPGLRQHLICTEHDLLRDPPLGRLDAIGLMSAATDAAEWPALVERLKGSLRVGGLLHVGDAMAGEALGDGFTAIAPGLYQRLGRRGTLPIATSDAPAPLPSDHALLAMLAPPAIVVDAEDRVRRRLGPVHAHLLAPHAGWPRALDDALPPARLAAVRALLAHAREGAADATVEIDGLRLRAHLLANQMIAVVFEALDDRLQRLTAANARLAAANAELRAQVERAP